MEISVLLMQYALQIIQIIMVNALIVQQQISQSSQNLKMMFIIPLIVMVIVITSIILKRRYNQYQNSLHLVSMLLILTTLMMFDEKQENFIFITNILFTLFIKIRIGNPKQTLIYLIISGLSTLIKPLTECYDIGRIILVIISFFIQIGLIFFMSESSKQDKPFNYELNQTRGQSIGKIIENFIWLDGSNALVYDSNKQVLHDFQKNQINMHRLFQTGLYFQCNNQLMVFYELLSHIITQENFLSRPFYQYLDKDYRVIVNIILVYYLVHYQDIPKLDHQLKSLLDISSSISHELSSHLNCILTIAQLSYDDPDLNMSIKENIIEPILANSQQLELIINNLKDYNNIQSNNFMSQIQQFNIVQEVVQICGLFRKLIEEKQIKMEFQFKVDKSFIESDRQRFRQIFYQILQNAIKYTNNKVIIALTNYGKNLIKVEITDKGQGMNEQESKTLKEILNLSKMIRVSEKSVGCSLGLYISEERKIDFETLQYIGSTFIYWLKNYEQQTVYKSSATIKRLSLEQYQDAQLENLIQAQSDIDEYESQSESNSLINPQSNSQGNSQSNSRKSIQRRNGLMKNSVGDENLSLNFVNEEYKVTNPPLFKINIKSLNQFNQYLLADQKLNCCAKVLIVDDEYFNIFALKAFMKQQQYNTESAFDGYQALDKFKTRTQNPCVKCQSNNFQLIFLDINMPNMDGIQSVKEVKKMVQSGLIPNVCCAANSAFCDLDTKQRAYEAGMDIYLSKPLNLPILRSLIHKVFLQDVFVSI